MIKMATLTGKIYRDDILDGKIDSNLDGSV